MENLQSVGWQTQLQDPFQAVYCHREVTQWAPWADAEEWISNETITEGVANKGTLLC